MPDTVAQRVLLRWRLATSQVDTPESAASYIEHMLGPLFRNKGHFKVEAGRGVTVEYARWEQNEYAKKQLTEGYTNVPPNVRVVIGIVPEFGSSTWDNLTVKEMNREFDEYNAKNSGIRPIRRASKLTPDKAVKLLVDWFTKNARQLVGDIHA